MNSDGRENRIIIFIGYSVYGKSININSLFSMIVLYTLSLYGARHNTIQANESVSVASNPPFRHVPIGVGNTATLPCFKYHAKNRYNASTIVDLIDGDEELQEMVDTIQAEKSTVYALVDQILIGIAESLEFNRVEFGGSTFQSKISVWHQRREEVLEMMKKVDV